MRARSAPELPPRPYVPPAAAAALAAIATAAILLDLGWRAALADPAASAPVGCAIAAGAIAALLAAAGLLLGGSVSIVRRARAWLLWASLGIFLAMPATMFGLAQRSSAQRAILSHPASAYRFILRGDETISDYGFQITAEARDARDALVALVRISARGRYATGDELRVVGRVKPLDDSDWSRNRFMQGVVATVQIVHVRSRRRAPAPDPIGAFRRTLLRAMDPGADPARALMAAVVCGRTSEFNRTGESDVFAATGTSHLIAVSGSHLALLSALMIALLLRARVSPRARTLVVLVLMGCYVVLTGCSPSAERSFAMTGFAMAARLGRRRAHALSALALTSTVLVGANPGAVFDMGFQLSVTSVLFICVFNSYIAFTLRRLGLPAGVAGVLSVTLCAQWATLPITVPAFGRLSLVAPLANLILGPIIGGLLLLGLLAAPLAAAIPAAAGALGAPVALARLALFMARSLAAMPFASLHVALSVTVLAGLYALAVAIFAWWGEIGRRQLGAVMALAAIFCVAHVIYWTKFAPAGVTVLDVGQGDAILVRDGGSTLLVDTGLDDAVCSALARNNVYRLDAVLLTHWDLDHCGGVPEILRMMPVGHLILARGAKGHEPVELRAVDLPDVTEVDAGDRISVGSFSGTVAWPTSRVDGLGNEDSLVVAMRYRHDGRRLSILLTGDSEMDQERAYAPSVGHVDVLKLGHHGSAVSVDEEILEELDPAVAIASAGAHNRYGHPTAKCVRAVKEFGTRFLCTKDTGDVGVFPETDGVDLVTEREPAVE